MKEENRKFITSDGFYERVKLVMDYKNISIDSLHEIINNEIGYEISKNNLNIYLQRVPNTNFLIALSKALSISSDYLLGISDEDLFGTGFNYDYESQKYKKYLNNDYSLYFYPTVSNSPQNHISGKQRVTKAKLSVFHDVSYKAKLTIITDENEKKEYVGNFLLSDSYDVGYIYLHGTKLGEMVFMSFCDPNINGNVVKVEALVGLMISVSSGDFKRVPVMSRFVLSKVSVATEKFDAVLSNLILNTKYINLSDDSLSDALHNLNLSDDLEKELLSRLRSAFPPKTYRRIEEGYLLNTIKNDFNLPFDEIYKLINNLRLNSLDCVSNNKANKSVDTHLFRYISDVKTMEAE